MANNATGKIVRENRSHTKKSFKYKINYREYGKGTLVDGFKNNISRFSLSVDD